MFFQKTILEKMPKNRLKNERFTKMDFLRLWSDALFFSVWHAGNDRLLFLAVFASCLIFLLLPLVESS
jgi:hypothetical protein